MVVRIAKGKGPFSPDRNHIHHKLIDLGFSKKKAVCLIVLTGALLVVANWILLWYLDCNVLLILDLSFGVLVNLFIYRRIKRKEYRKQRQVEEELLELDS